MKMEVMKRKIKNDVDGQHGGGIIAEQGRIRRRGMTFDDNSPQFVVRLRQ